MKKFFIILAIIFAPSLTFAQGCGPTNPNCIVPTAPAGTSNNQAASTAFVTNAFLAGPYIDVALAAPPVLCNGMDQTLNLNTLTTSLQIAGTGGTLIFHACTYTFTSATCILIPNGGDGIANYSHQVSIRFTGAGNWKTGEGGAISGGTVFDLRGNCSNGKIQTYGLGNFELDHITLTNLGDSDGQPFIYTTGTSVNLHDYSCIGSSNVVGTTSNQDCEIYGGTSTSVAAGTNAPFQGYGSISINNYYNRIRRVAYLRVYANGNATVQNATVWNASGSNYKGVKTITSVQAGGSGYSPGDLIQLAGGTCDVKPVLNVLTVSTGAVATAAIANDGNCTITPSNPVTQNATTGGGTGATFNLVYTFTGAAVEIDADPAFTQAGTGSTTGALISLPIVEMGSYPYAVKLQAGADWNNIFASSYDAVINNPTLGLVHSMYGAAFNQITGGQAPNSSIPELVDEAPTINQNSLWSSVSDGYSTKPNLDIYSNFKASSILAYGAGTSVLVQPVLTQSDSSTMVSVLRSNAGTNPSANIWSLSQNGALEWGGTQAGNITNDISSGMQITGNGRIMTASSTITISTGTSTGDIITQAADILFKDATGTLYAQLVGSFSGLKLGAALDVGLSRIKAGFVEIDTGVAGTLAIMRVSHAEIGTGQTVPAVSTCGTSPAVAANSTDAAGNFTTGTGNPTTCTITFNTGYSTGAFCSIFPANSAAVTAGAYISASSKMAFTIITSNTNNQSYNYTCQGS